ncbi:hypothetical protein [Raoultibacter phocaeensis]|uniref:hypothetical protein n=1 Tax=Raoultibacter phocaeensis TaxID=2479841 RepID=UPI001118324A|nr:hypothetical protein [Raoultibacter phocaeensis]
MDRDDTYSLISVNAGDDEEIVIQTGVRKAKGEQSEPAEGADEGGALREGDYHGKAGIALDPSIEADSERASGGNAEAAETESEPVAPRQKKPRYRETTKEDLETVEPMSNTQKAVIGCVFLFIVGFVVYYLFLR